MILGHSQYGRLRLLGVYERLAERVHGLPLASQ